TPSSQYDLFKGYPSYIKRQHRGIASLISTAHCIATAIRTELKCSPSGTLKYLDSASVILSDQRTHSGDISRIRSGISYSIYVESLRPTSDKGCSRRTLSHRSRTVVSKLSSTVVEYAS